MKPVLKKISFSSIKATVYSVADLQVATDMFSPDNLLGEGSFGRSYKAQFDGGKVHFCTCYRQELAPHGITVTDWT